MSERFPDDTDLQNAWDEFCDAKRWAEKTLDIQDGVVAGKLWGRFIRLFERASYTKDRGGQVVRINRFETNCERRRRAQ